MAKSAGEVHEGKTMTIDDMIRELERARDTVGGDALVCAQRFNHDCDETITINMTVDNIKVDDGAVMIHCTEY